MKEQYITITGIKHYYGIIPFEIGRKITCVKEPDNYYDQEAIRCQVKHIGTVGYVANSTCKVVDGLKEKKEHEPLPEKEEDSLSFN